MSLAQNGLEEFITSFHHLKSDLLPHSRVSRPAVTDGQASLHCQFGRNFLARPQCSRRQIGNIAINSLLD